MQKMPAKRRYTCLYIIGTIIGFPQEPHLSPPPLLPEEKLALDLRVWPVLYVLSPSPAGHDPFGDRPGVPAQLLPGRLQWGFIKAPGKHLIYPGSPDDCSI